MSQTLEHSTEQKSTKKTLVSFDFAIKYLLRDKGNYAIVEGFLSALFKEQGYSPVKILALLDTESNKEEYSQKKSLADLIVEDDQHRKYIVEIERQEVKHFIHKSCFNTSRLIVDQVPSGGNFENIKKVFHISLLYFDVGNSPIHHGKTILRELDTQKKLSVHIEDANHNIIDATDIFPEYIFISVPQFDGQVRRELDEWLYVIKHSEVKPEFKSPYMQLVAEKLSILKMDTEMRNEYLNYKKVIHTYKDAIDTATDKGIRKGRAEGLDEGRVLGEEDGRIKASRAIAKNFLAAGLDKHLVAKNTGLTAEEIDDL